MKEKDPRAGALTGSAMPEAQLLPPWRPSYLHMHVHTCMLHTDAHNTHIYEHACTHGSTALHRAGANKNKCLYVKSANVYI